MFKPSKMMRIRIITHKKYSDAVLSALQDIGVMQIEQLPEEVLKLLGSPDESDYKSIADQAQRFRGLESLMLPVQSDKKYSFESIESLMTSARGVAIDDRVTQISKELDEIKVNLDSINSQLELLKRLEGFSGDLSILNTRSIVSFAVYGQQLKEVEAAFTSSKEMVVTKLQNATIFSLRKAQEKEFGATLEKYRVTVEFIPQISGTIAENGSDLHSNLDFIMERKKSLEVELRGISEQYHSLVSALREQFDIEMDKIDVIAKLGRSASIIAIEGWVPNESVDKLEVLIASITKSRCVFERIKTKDTPPTKMHNPVTAKLYEFFVRFYSIPKSDEIDPTIMFAIAFPIFFGFMVGDFGYGLVMLLLALFIVNRVNHPPKVSRLPKMITSFVSLLVSNQSLKILAKSIIPGAIIAMILGIIFNEYFGFHLPYATPFNVEQNLGTLLVLAGYIGVFMVEFGFFLGFLNKMAEGDKKHALAKLGWMAAGLGIVLLGLNVLHQQPMGLNNLDAVASYVLLVVGVLIIIVYEGGSGLMELPSLISHMLSYTRLVGILLASVILAEVVDLIFLGGWHHSILLGLVGTLILIVGQLFNIIIALFEPGIQGARLIYVEFFSKFYEGNGKLFKPFAVQRHRTLSRFKL